MSTETIDTPSSEILAAMVKIIINVANLGKIILFGSQAKETAKETSDYDVLIVDKSTFGQGRSRRKEIGKVGWALATLRVPIDILMYSLDEFEQRSQSPNHLVCQALKEGKVLYERDV